MSNIGKKPINIPDGVKVEISNNSVEVIGKIGKLYIEFDPKIKITIKEQIIYIDRSSDLKKHKELHGLYRALISNMIIGVSEGFKKELHFVGVGYGVEKKGDFLLINAKELSVGIAT